MARSIPRPRPRSNSPGPKRWRSEEAVALYEPPATPVSHPSLDRASISPISPAGTPTGRRTPTNFSSRNLQPLTPESANARRLVYPTPDSSRPSDEGRMSSIDMRKEQTDEIFRTRSTGSSKRSAKVVTPPVMEVTFSQDSDPRAGGSAGSAGSVENKDRGTTTRIG